MPITMCSLSIRWNYGARLSFEPTVKNGNVYARGACDDKGQCFYAMEAVRAFVQLGKKNGVNIKFFIEGERRVRQQGNKRGSFK